MATSERFRDWASEAKVRLEAVLAAKRRWEMGGRLAIREACGGVSCDISGQCSLCRCTFA